jgi:hypothetical protein
MTKSINHPKRRGIVARELGAQERAWIQEIIDTNRLWSDIDLSSTKVVAECDCGNCRTVYLDSPQNTSLKGTRGYIGRIDIRTKDEFGITVTLDQLNGKLSELYVNAVDLTDEGSRPFPERWSEIAHIVESM